jgi:hypothetical protein
MSKDEQESFYNQIKMNHLTQVFKGQNPSKLPYFIMILNTIFLPYKAGPTNISF